MFLLFVQVVVQAIKEGSAAARSELIQVGRLDTWDAAAGLTLGAGIAERYRAGPHALWTAGR